MDPEAYFSAMDLAGFELLIFAPRGVGASSVPPAPQDYRIAGYVKDLESLRQHLEVERLTMYGNSHGGCAALAYACGAPERVERLVVTNAPPRIDEAYRTAATEVQRRFSEVAADGSGRLAASETASELLYTTDDPEERKRHYRTLMSRYVVDEGQAETAYLDRLCAAPMNYDAAPVMYEEFLTEELDLLQGAAQVSVPALVIAGELDVVVPPVAMQWIAEALPNARYFEFTRIGHFPEVEAGPAFAELVSSFLAA
jgi:pimeloyl-ACP methyl ester carboxylesterase